MQTKILYYEVYLPLHVYMDKSFWSVNDYGNLDRAAMASNERRKGLKCELSFGGQKLETFLCYGTYK